MSSTERLWEHRLPALSKFCCPAESDKEATGTASSVSSLINLLIRLIQRWFNGGKLSPSGKSPDSQENYICFPSFLRRALIVFFFMFFLKIKGTALDCLCYISHKCTLHSTHLRSYIRLVFPPNIFAKLNLILDSARESSLKPPFSVQPRLFLLFKGTNANES